MNPETPGSLLASASDLQLQATRGERCQVVPPGDLVYLVAEGAPSPVYPVAFLGGCRASGVGGGALLFLWFLLNDLLALPIQLPLLVN